jgi:hypothetical protein
VPNVTLSRQIRGCNVILYRAVCEGVRTAYVELFSLGLDAFFISVGDTAGISVSFERFFKGTAV